MPETLPPTPEQLANRPPPPPAPPMPAPPAAPIASATQYFCRRCMRVVPVTMQRVGMSFVPTGEHTTTSRPVCRECNSGVIKYTIEDMARLLNEQNRLVSEALAINQRNVELNRQMLESQRWIDPATGQLLRRDQVDAAGAHVDMPVHRRGSGDMVYPVTPDGVRQMVEALRSAQAFTSAAPNLPVQELQRQIADLKRQLAAAGVTPRNNTGRAARQVQI